MLGKLLKYEIPALGRKLVPLYIGWAATAALLGLMVGPAQSKSEFGVVLSGLLYTAAATAVVVMGAIMIIQRYSKSLLGDGGYFSHVLPVTASEHIASKSIAALVWVLLSGVALLITGIIIVIFSGTLKVINIDGITEFLRLLSQTPLTGWVNLLELLILFAISTTKSILAIYAALTIGHQAKTRTTLASIGAYFGVLIFESTVGRICMAVFGNMINDFDILSSFHGPFAILSLISIAIGAVYFFICKYLMEKRLNLA